MQVRQYGSKGPRVAVLHGGPGLTGSVAPVARELADAFRVVEPLQTARSVEEQLTELHTVVDAGTALIGWSWGAMLALCYAARWPVARLVLIGCGTFDEDSRALLHEARKGLVVPPDATCQEAWDLLRPFDTYDPLTNELEVETFDRACLEAVWADMLRLQDEGVYPQEFRNIEAPVAMLHGRHDPHPGRAIYENLKPYLPQLTYHEFERCGHLPWLERHARDEFYAQLRATLFP